MPDVGVRDDLAILDLGRRVEPSRDDTVAFVLAAVPRSWRCAESPTWHAVADVARRADGDWSLRRWSWFDNGWTWVRVRRPRRVRFVVSPAEWARGRAEPPTGPP